MSSYESFAEGKTAVLVQNRCKVLALEGKNFDQGSVQLLIGRSPCACTQGLLYEQRTRLLPISFSSRLSALHLSCIALRMQTWPILEVCHARAALGACSRAAFHIQGFLE